MDRSISRIRQLFNETLNQASSTMFYATVKKVDEKERTCEVEVDGVTFSEVLLTTTAENVGMMLVPTAGSSVLVSCIAGSNRYAVSMFSQVEQILTTVGKSTIKITNEEIIINGGTLNGLVKVDELKTNLDKMTDRIDGIITALNGGTVTTGAPDSGAALIASIKVALEIIKKKEDFSSIENTKIKH